MGGSRRWLLGVLAAGLVVAGLVGYFASVGADRANTLAGPIGAVLALVALLAPVFVKPSEERTVAPPEARLTAKMRDGIQVIGGKFVQSRAGVIALAIVAIVVVGLVAIVVDRGRDANGSALRLMTVSPIPTPNTTLTPAPDPPSVTPVASPSATPSPGGHAVPGPSRSSAAPAPTRTPGPTGAPPAPLLLYNGAEYVALTTGPKLVGKADGPDVEVETLQVDPLGMGIAPPDGATSCGSARWQDAPLAFDIATRPAFCVRSRLGAVWLLELAPTVDGTDRPRPYRATFTLLST